MHDDDFDPVELGFLFVSYRELVSVSLERQHEQLKRIAALEAQLQSLREELRRYTASRVA